MSFKNIDEAAIEDMESFVRYDLMTLIQMKCNRSNLTFDEAEKKNFFGNYDIDHMEFQFSKYDSDLIMRIVEHVNNVLNVEGIAYFSLKSNETIVRSTKWYFLQQQTLRGEGQTEQFDTQTHRILRKLLKAADENAIRPKGGYRFDEELKSFASYLSYMAGNIAYETLRINLPLVFPSSSTTNRYMARPHHQIIEGELRCDELLAYLKERNLPPCVCISEDATRVINRVQYDAKSNQLVGFVLPMDHNGLSIPFSFKARSALEIANHFSNGNPIASFMNAIIAEPFGGAPSFCLSVFGTDSKYTTKQITKRWRFITAELNSRNITVLTIGSDSDPKNNAAMRNLSNLGIKSTSILQDVQWFSCGNSLVCPIYVQDTPHNVTKLRNWFLKSRSDKIPIGNKFVIDVNHLQYLIDTESKDKHFLTKTTLNPVDRQNYKSALRMCDQRVIDLLKQRVHNCDATVKFLEIMQNINAAYEDKTLSPKQRIQKMWYSIFILRVWRQYIYRTKGLTLKNHFLTANCYSCLELNAHSMILLILFLKEIDKPHLFLPKMFSSQACESFFRQIRSVSTVYSTVTNCTTKEFLERIQKIQVSNNITVSASQFEFPRSSHSNNSSDNSFALPGEVEIIEIIEECKERAIFDAIEIGLLKEPVPDINCPLFPFEPTNAVQKQMQSMKIGDDPQEPTTFNLKKLNLRNYAKKIDQREIRETSPYVEIIGSRKLLVYKKTAICWYFTKEPVKLSSDRIQRSKNCYAKNKSEKTIFRRLKISMKYSKPKIQRTKKIRKY